MVVLGEASQHNMFTRSSGQVLILEMLLGMEDSNKRLSAEHDERSALIEEAVSSDHNPLGSVCSILAVYYTPY